MQGPEGPIGSGDAMALLFVLGICVITVYVVRRASGRLDGGWRGPEPVRQVTELPPLPVPPVIPDTVPSAWVEAYGTDDGP